jgi:sodium-dependent dicarboxylate transporter 2/3/5
MAQAVSGVLGDGHWFIVMVTSVAFIILLTEFSSNTAAAALMVPLFGSVGEALGMPPFILPFIIGFGASLAFMLPVATPPNAIVFGTGHIQQKEMLKAGSWMVLCSILILSLLSWFVWM